MSLVHPKNHLYLPQLRKGVVRFRARTSITWQKCNLKLNMVPGGLFSGCCDSRTLATANSLEIDGENQANGFRSLIDFAYAFIIHCFITYEFSFYFIFRKCILAIVYLARILFYLWI